MKLANLVGPVLINRFVGKLVGGLTGQRIPYRGLRIDTSNPLITDNSRASLLWRSYERAEFAFVNKYLIADGNVVELGSSIGVLSSIIARRLAPGRRLTAVEADPRLVPSLKANLAINNVADRVEVHNAALGYGVDMLDFGVGETSVGGSVSRSAIADTIRVPTTTLAATITDPNEPFSVVSDIEGAEWDLLEQEGDLLARAKIIVMELHDRIEGAAGQGWRDLAGIFARDPRFTVVDSYGPVIVMRGNR